MDLNYFEIEKMRVNLLHISNREKYEEPITDKEKEMMSMFDCLNTKKSTEQNIENFFEVLGELIEFEKGGGKS